MSNTESEWVFRLAGTDWVRVSESFGMVRSWPGGDVLMPEDTVRRLDRQMRDEVEQAYRRIA